MPPDCWPLHVIEAVGDPSARPLRVRQLLQSIAAGSSDEFTLIGIDEWTTFFNLRWFFVSIVVDDDVDQRLHAGLVWHVTDDLGNSYDGGDFGGGGGSSAHWTFTSQFAPGVNKKASALTIGVESPISGELLTWTVSLRPTEPDGRTKVDR